jgi:hypothetical protein
MLLNWPVDLRSRCSLSAGQAVSLLGVNACGVSPVLLLPQESSTFRSNQFHFQRNAFKTLQKQQTFRKQPLFKNTGIFHFSFKPC